MRKFASAAVMAVLIGAGALAAQEPPARPGQSQPRQDPQRERASDKADTGREIAELLSKATQPLERCIQIAERESSGKVAMAVCCTHAKPATPRGEGATPQTPGQPKPGQRSDASEGNETVVWKITCLTAGDQLVEVAVDATNGNVLAKRNVSSISAAVR